MCLEVDFNDCKNQGATAQATAMTRTQACRDQLGWMVENCPLDRTSIIPIKRAHNFCAKHVEISTLSTDAIQPLVKIKDVKVQERVVAALKKMIDSGEKPTRHDVVACIQNEHPLTQKTMPAPTELRQITFSNARYFDKPVLSPMEKESFTNIWVRKCLSKEQKETLAVMVLETREFDSNLDAIGALIERAGLQLEHAQVPASDPVSTPTDSSTTETPGTIKVIGHAVVRAKLAGSA